MTKQETIAKAYGTYWKNYEGFTDENGWNWHYSSDEIDPDIFEYKGSGGNFRSRPKSLAGIENNRGWIKIESEEDLPKDESISYHSGWFEKSKLTNYKVRTFIEVVNQIKRFNSVNVYQPIVKPEPPIY